MAGGAFFFFLLVMSLKAWGAGAQVVDSHNQAEAAKSTATLDFLFGDRGEQVVRRCPTR